MGTDTALDLEELLNHSKVVLIATALGCTSRNYTNAGLHIMRQSDAKDVYCGSVS